MEIELHVRNVAHHCFLVLCSFYPFFFVYSFWLFLDISGHKTSNVGKLNMKKGDNVKVYELSSLLVIV